MTDRMPTPEEFAAAAKEVADARAAVEDCTRAEQIARTDRCNAENRLSRAEAALRSMTDRVAPQPDAPRRRATA